MTKVKHLKYHVTIYFISLSEEIVVLTILEAPQSYDQVLVEQGGFNITRLNTGKGEAIDMLGFAI